MRFQMHGVGVQPFDRRGDPFQLEVKFLQAGMGRLFCDPFQNQQLGKSKRHCKRVVHLVGEGPQVGGNRLFDHNCTSSPIIRSIVISDPDG
jgi:hypothetical protein